MLTTMFLSVLLMVGGLGGAAAAAASDLQVSGKSISGDKTLLSGNDRRYAVRRQQPHQHTRSETRRSLDLERLNMQMTPTTSKSKSSSPTIIKLFQPTIQPHRHANMPMRFGRDSDPDNDNSPNSPNMPQRFGRAWKVTRVCAECDEELNPALPQRFGMNSLYWRFLNTLASKQIISTGLHWAAVYDFTTKKWKWKKNPAKNEDTAQLY
ncbi:pro-FMRFamide-related neuropeptide VF [Solea senegalensis]|uniref:Pro-FMRFamide-related neuropeptide VF n=1 Tax=Solea senegalensis TaxID=28829 RepID=A0AAV6R915_SOLSE|nr:pro-FMRFamide-related neuropeptide VF isoform X1 [Solea senegalensis]KAG7501064.1 pro-FMRFamide-related neuropeptide VF [Solea senegalensis]